MELCCREESSCSTGAVLAAWNFSPLEWKFSSLDWNLRPLSFCRTSFDGENMYMSMTEPSQDYVPASQSFPGPSLESEDFNIPPITPPSLPDHSLVHLNEIESGYHSLCHPMNHNGLLPFHPQNMDLPEITVSNMLGQDGTLLSSSLSV